MYVGQHKLRQGKESYVLGASGVCLCPVRFGRLQRIIGEIIRYKVFIKVHNCGINPA